MTAPTCNYCGGTGGGVEFPVFPITPGESFGTICVPCDEAKPIEEGGEYHFVVVGDDLAIEAETLTPMAYGEFVEHVGYEVTRYTGSAELRPELRGAPVLKGFAGPMYNGEKDGHTVIRYESWAAYERFSA